MDRFETPITLLTFNRPEKTLKVLEQIRRVKPSKLLVVCDGARNEKEAQKVKEVRALFENLDWPCELLTNFSETNLGCKKRVSSGIDWAFSQVDECIFLEDDCLPNLSFFSFCRELLKSYKDNKEIGLISGYNPISKQELECDLLFSRYPHIWGWASWADRWKLYDVTMKDLDDYEESILHEISHNKKERRFWKEHLRAVKDGKIDTWDAQVSYMCFRHHLLTALPKHTLIENIGFDHEATHTHSTLDYQMQRACELDFPIKYPREIEALKEYDFERAKLEYQRFNIVEKVFHKIRGLSL